MYVSIQEKALFSKCLLNDIIFRAKITDLATEISRMQKEVDQFNQENATFLTYEKRYVHHYLTCQVISDNLSNVFLIHMCMINIVSMHILSVLIICDCGRHVT